MDGWESAVWHIGGSSTPRRRRSILNPRIAKCSLTKMSLQTSDVCPETLRAQFLARPPSFLILSSDPSSCSISCISLSAKSRHVRAMQKATWSQRGLNVIVCKKHLWDGVNIPRPWPIEISGPNIVQHQSLSRLCTTVVLCLFPKIL